MAELQVWNHSTSAQRRPVQFTVPLGLSWGDVLSIGPEALHAEKQYDDGERAVYVCPAPAAGWPAGTAQGRRETYTITQTTETPDYRFKFAEPFADDVCGQPPAFDLRFLPTLKIYRTSGDPNPIEVRATTFHPWSEGAHPDVPGKLIGIANGTVEPEGQRQRWYTTYASNQGWHLFFDIGFDSEMAIAEFDAEVLHSDENYTSGWTVPCHSVVLVWPSTIAVKARHTPEGIQVGVETGTGRTTMTLPTAFTDVTAGNWAHAGWNGTWYSQHSFGFAGFMLGKPANGDDPPAFDTTEFAAAAPLRAVIDATSWDTHWLGGGNSGDGITLNNPNNTRPDYSASAHFFSWYRTGGATDEFGLNGCVMSIRPRSQGLQPGFGLVRGHDALIGDVSPLDYEVGAYDVMRRPHYLHSEGVNPPDRSPMTTEPSRWKIGDGPTEFAIYNGYPTSSYRMGKPSGSKPVIPRYRSGGNDLFSEFHYGDQHNSNATVSAAFALMKRPAIFRNMSWALHYDEINHRRPNFGSSDLTGTRAIGRRFGRLAGMWEAAPGLRLRLHSLVYDTTHGYYPCMKNPDPTGNNIGTGNGGLEFQELLDSIPDNFPFPSSTPSGLPRLDETVPMWMRDMQETAVRRQFDVTQFLYGGEGVNAFGASEPGWETVGAAGMIYWWHAINKTGGLHNGGVLIDPNSLAATDFKLWGEIVFENTLKHGTARVGRTVVSGVDLNFVDSGGSGDYIYLTTSHPSSGFRWPTQPSPGETITVTGTVSNNGSYTVVSSSERYIYCEGLTTESGVQATITRPRTRRVMGLQMTYVSGQMLQSSTMRTPYPPGPSGGPSYPHPFFFEDHPLFQYCATFNGRSESSWHMGAANWYRQFGRDASLVAEAQVWWEEMLGWVNTLGANGGGQKDRYNGWIGIFFSAIAPLDPT